MSMVETGSFLRSSSSLPSSASSLSNAIPRGPSMSDRNANSSALKPWWSASSSAHSSSCHAPHVSVVSKLPVRASGTGACIEGETGDEKRVSRVKREAEG